jgi:DNA-binding beta-propeller fold protein YncE
MPPESHVQRRGFVAVALSLVACEAPREPVYDPEPFLGEAFPDRARPLEWPDGPAGVVTDSLADTLSFVDLTTGELFDQRPVGRNPVDVDGPHHVAIAREREELFIALSYPVVGAGGPHAGHGESAKPGWVQRISLRDARVLGQVRVDPNPGDLALSEDGSRLVVSHFDLAKAVAAGDDVSAARANLAVVDVGEIELSGSRPARRVPACAAPHGMALLGAGATHAFVACYGEDRLARVDLSGEVAPELFDLGPGVVFGAPSYGPYAVALSPDASLLVVSNLISKDLRFFLPAVNEFDLSRTLKIPGGGAPMFPAFTPDGRELVVPFQSPDAIVRFDVLTGEVLRARPFEVDECQRPHEVELVGEEIVVVCEGLPDASGRVLRLDPTFTLLSTTEVGRFPDAIALR